MKIQIITNNQININDKEVSFASLNNPMSLDVYDVNIVNLNSEKIWRNNENSHNKIDILNDFKSIKTMIYNSKVSTNIIIVPQNCKFLYCYSSYSQRYEKQIQLKDMLADLTGVLEYLIPYFNNLKFYFERSETLCLNEKLKASFYPAESYIEVLTESELSQKPTTALIHERLIVTTLDILESQESLMAFLHEIGVIPSEKQEAPEWIDEVVFGDDELQKKLIEEKNKIINDANEQIKQANEKLAQNMRYKSILYTNGEELVHEVYNILEQILDCDMSGFEDKKREDFLIKKENVTFIGEIKGIATNVKSGNITQLETHYQSYNDELEEKGNEENVKQLLIINPLRMTKLEDREPVHEKQITLAVKYEALIIETKTLLKVFEAYLNQEIKTEQIIESFSSKKGLLNLTDLLN